MATTRRSLRLPVALMAALVVALLYTQWRAREELAELPRLGVAAEQIAVAGLSSGAYMAGQFQIAHSRAVSGAGLIAGGPYGCAESPTAQLLPWPASVPQNLARALARCMAADVFAVPDPERLAARARALASAGAIDPIAGVLDDRIYLFSGGADRTVSRAVVEAARRFYEALGVPPAQILFDAHRDAGHGVLTREVGNACEASRAPYVNDCDYDQAGAILAHIYGPPAAVTDTLPQGDLALFDQGPYVRGLSHHDLDERGFVYVPRACRQAVGCRLLIVFHGCGQSRERLGDRFVRNAGFTRAADLHRLVVLFPQVAASSGNPEGCWDWWGYTGPNWLTRSAAQIEAVWRMAVRLAEAGPS